MSTAYTESLNKLIEELGKLPGVGPKVEAADDTVVDKLIARHVVSARLGWCDVERETIRIGTNE